MNDSVSLTIPAQLNPMYQTFLQAMQALYQILNLAGIQVHKFPVKVVVDKFSYLTDVNRILSAEKFETFRKQVSAFIHSQSFDQAKSDLGYMAALSGQNI